MNCYNFKVCTKCLTYNHASFIVDAMHGFCMQDTTFPVVTVIVDDASTDGEQDVIKQYLQENFELSDTSVAQMEETDDYNLIFAQHRINKNCYFAVYLLKYNHHAKKSKRPYFAPYITSAKYIACCEGDDYWIDRHKLQKQIDFLEHNTEYSLIFHNAIVHYQDSPSPDCLMRQFKSGTFTTAQLMELWQLPFASFVYRQDVEDSEVHEKLRRIWNGGYARLLAASMSGKVYGVAECMSVYRKNKGGVSNTMSPARCLQIDYDFAIATGDVEAINVMHKRSEQMLIDQMRGIIKGDAKAREVWLTALSYNKWVPYKAIMLYIVKWPMRKARGLKHRLMNK